MKIQTSILNSASLSSVFNGTPYTLIGSSSTSNDFYYVKDVIWKFRYSSSAYNVPDDSYFSFELLSGSYSSSIFSYPGPNVGYPVDIITPLNPAYTIDIPASYDLVLRYSGSVPTTGNSTVQIDIHYETQNVTATNPGFVFDSNVTFLKSISIGPEALSIGTGSLSIGQVTTASGEYSVAMGGNTNAANTYTRAEGISTTATGYASHAEGLGTLSPGYASHAEGYYNSASGDYSHAEGGETNAMGTGSHAEGWQTVALGIYSNTSGNNTIASGAYQTVVGRFNTQNNTTDVFVIGGGLNNANRKDIFSVSTSSVTISGSLNISGGITGTFSGTSSWATNAISASTAIVATSASFINTLRNGDNKTVFITFVDSNNTTDSYEQLNTQANLTYNPATQILSATSITSSFTGSLLGTASLASTVLTLKTSSAAICYPVFVDSNNSPATQESLYTAASENFTFIPSIGSVSATSFTGSFSGSLVGTASWAESASRAVTSSYVTGSIFSGNNLAISASFALTASHLLGGSSGTPGGANKSIQFNGAGAFSGSNNFTFDSSSNQVQLTGSLIVSGNIDTIAKSLIGPEGQEALSFNTRRLIDSNGMRSVRWEDRWLVNSSATTVTDWENSQLTSGDGASSYVPMVDWSMGLLNIRDGNAGTPYVALTMVDWAMGMLYSSDLGTPQTGLQAIDWQNRLAYDGTGATLSIAWDTRELIDANGNVALRYSDTGSSNQVRLYGTASYALAAETFPFTGSAIVTGSMIVTGSLTVVTGSSIELRVTNTGVKIGNAIGDTHTITGSVSTSGSLTVGSGSLAITSPAAITAPFTINALNTTNTNYAAQITAGSGMQGLRINTNGQSQYVARNTNITDRELRFQLFTDGHMYFQQVVTAGTTGSNLIIRTSGDGGTNTGSVIIASAGTQRLRSGTTGIKIGSEATLIPAGATLDITGSTLITGSLLTSGSITDVGTSTISGSLTFAMTSSVSPFNGEIVRFGAGTLTAGQLYFLSSSGTWSLANANSTGSSTGMLGIAVGSSPTTNGLLVRGFAFSGSFTQSTGSILYVATSSGIFTETSPSSSNHVVRVVGYKTTIPGTVYFDPDKTWVTLA